MRRLIVLVAVLALVLVAAAPAGAVSEQLSGPETIWLSDPEGNDGDNGIEQGDAIAGGTGTARVNANGASIQVRAQGLEPGHAYTMWVVYFNDKTTCGAGGCGLADVDGVIWGAGKIANANGSAGFTARVKPGAGADHIGETPPPPFAFAAYSPSADNELHIVIRSHGPRIPGSVHDQLTTFGGGCAVNVGPAPEEVGDFPVPQAPGECGDVQVYIFGT